MRNLYEITTRWEHMCAIILKHFRRTLMKYHWTSSLCSLHGFQRHLATRSIKLNEIMCFRGLWLNTAVGWLACLFRRREWSCCQLLFVSHLVTRFSETSDCLWTTRGCNLEDSAIHSHRRQNPKFYLGSCRGNINLMYISIHYVLHNHSFTRCSNYNFSNIHLKWFAI